MMRSLLRYGARAAISFAVWTVWLVLSVLLVFQAVVAVRHEFAVPEFVLHALEDRLAASGVHAKFGRTRFDPSGRILVEDVRLTLPGFEEPVITARAIYGRLDLWALLAGHFVPEQVEVVGVSARVPAMLSPSGRADELVHDLDGVLVPRGPDVDLPYLSGWVGNVAISVSGSLRVTSGPRRSTGPLPMTAVLAQHYGRWTRRAALALAALPGLDHPILRARLSPDAGGLARADVVMVADGVRVATPVALDATGLRLTGQWIVGGEAGQPARLELAARRLSIAGRGSVRELVARLDGHGTQGKALPAALDRAAVAAREARVDGIVAVSPYGLFELANYPKVNGTAGAALWDAPVFVSITGDARDRSGVAEIRAQVAPGVLGALASLAHADLRPFLGWTDPIALEGSATVGAGGRLSGADVRFAAAGVSARGVRIDETRGRIEYDGRRIWAPEVMARVGVDMASGTFEDTLATADYRFLLKGRLRPLDITPWIAGAWWPAFFGNFGFPRQPPSADIDLRGCWTNGNKAVIFLSVDAPDAVLEGLKSDELSGRLFVRPQFDDALDFTLRRGGGQATGSFTRSFDLAAGDWTSIGVDLTSTLDPVPIAAVLGSAGSAVSAFSFSRPPQTTFHGQFTGPAAKGGEHRQFTLAMSTDSRVLYRGFPLDRVSFTATARDRALRLDDVAADVAGGSVRGHLTLTDNAKQTVSFEATVHDVSLGQAIAAVNAVSTGEQAEQADARAARFVQEKANVRMDASVSASGPFGSPYGFEGTGSMQLHGGEIGQIRMLGLLSALLRFTALRFTAAKADFKIDGPQLVFPDLTITGANSAIDAHGTYGMEGHELDFHARLRPFQESHALPQKFMDLVLTPLSDVLEVRLLGTLEKPSWVFANGASNLLKGRGSPNGVAPAH